MKTKLVVEIEGRVAEWEIGHGQLAGLFGYDFPAPPVDHPLVDLLSRHPSAAIRQQVAESFPLPDDVLLRLESDPILAVRAALLDGHSTTKARLSPSFLSKIIHESVDAAEKVSWNLSEFDEAESAGLAKSLLNHPDPAVRKSAVQHELGTKADRKKLKDDEDLDVRRAAS